MKTEPVTFFVRIFAQIYVLFTFRWPTVARHLIINYFHGKEDAQRLPSPPIQVFYIDVCSTIYVAIAIIFCRCRRR